MLGYPIKQSDGAVVVPVLRSLYLVVNHETAYARFAYDARSRLLIAIASEEHQKQIVRVLQLLRIQTPPTKDAGKEDAAQSIRIYPIKHIAGEQLVAKLRAQFVVVNHQEAHVRFGFDRRTHSLIVIAAENLQARIRDTIAVLDRLPADTTRTMIML